MSYVQQFQHYMSNWRDLNHRWAVVWVLLLIVSGEVAFGFGAVSNSGNSYTPLTCPNYANVQLCSTSPPNLKIASSKGQCIAACNKVVGCGWLGFVSDAVCGVENNCNIVGSCQLFTTPPSVQMAISGGCAVLWQADRLDQLQNTINVIVPCGAMNSQSDAASIVGIFVDDEPCKRGPCSDLDTCSYVLCLTDVTVNYSPTMPPNAVADVRGGSSDINHNFGGNYVWLVPVWQNTGSQVVTNIEFFTSVGPIAGYADLASGAGGAYRYLSLIRSNEISTCIIRVVLWRSSSASVLPSQGGWKNCTSDINAGRGGDYLYLCWAFL